MNIFKGEWKKTIKDVFENFSIWTIIKEISFFFGSLIRNISWFVVDKFFVIPIKNVLSLIFIVLSVILAMTIFFYNYDFDNKTENKDASFFSFLYKIPNQVAIKMIVDKQYQSNFSKQPLSKKVEKFRSIFMSIIRWALGISLMIIMKRIAVDNGSTIWNSLQSGFSKMMSSFFNINKSKMEAPTGMTHIHDLQDFNSNSPIYSSFNNNFNNNKNFKHNHNSFKSNIRNAQKSGNHNLRNNNTSNESNDKKNDNKQKWSQQQSHSAPIFNRANHNTYNQNHHYNGSENDISNHIDPAYSYIYNNDNVQYGHHDVNDDDHDVNDLTNNSDSDARVNNTMTSPINIDVDQVIIDSQNNQFTPLMQKMFNECNRHKQHTTSLLSEIDEPITPYNSNFNDDKSASTKKADKFLDGLDDNASTISGKSRDTNEDADFNDEEMVEIFRHSSEQLQDMIDLSTNAENIQDSIGNEESEENFVISDVIPQNIRQATYDSDSKVNNTEIQNEESDTDDSNDDENEDLSDNISNIDMKEKENDEDNSNDLWWEKLEKEKEAAAENEENLQRILQSYKELNAKRNETRHKL